MLKNTLFVVSLILILLSVFALVDAKADDKVFTYTDRAKQVKHTFILEREVDGEVFGVYFKKKIKQYKAKPIDSPFGKALKKNKVKM